MRQRWTKEQKAEFWKAFVWHRDEGCNIREAWRLAYADFRVTGKAAPGLSVFRKWYQMAMRSQQEDANRADLDGQDGSSFAKATEDKLDGQRGNPSGDPRGADGSDPASPEGSAEASGAETDDAAQEVVETAEETPDPDYTRRLELMCRLYRSRSEYNIDSLCDYLLPDLCAEEE